MRTKRTPGFLTLFMVVILVSIMVLANTWVQAYDMANPGFENDLDGWTSLGTVVAGLGDDYPTSGKIWTVLPYQTKMAVLSPDADMNNFSSSADALGLSTSSRTYLLGVFPGITNVAYIYTDVSLSANETFSMSWNYVATDYVPFNDASFCSMVNLDNLADIPEVNGYTSQVSILGATVPGTGNYSTDSYGSTGWQTASFTAAGAGTYRLGFAVYNLDDYVLDPYLFVDKQPGTTLLDGVPFSPVPPDDDPPPPPATTIPTVSTGAVSEMTTTAATIAGQVVNDGGEFVFERGVVVSTTSNPTTDDNTFSSGSGTGSFSASIVGLSAGMTYHARAYATNSKGTAYGNDVMFITIPAAPVAAAASGITKQSFTANWLSAVGAAGYRLDVATDAAFTQKLTAYDNLNVGSLTSYSISGLVPATTYYYRVRATNSSGVSANSNTINLLTEKADQTIDFPSLPVVVYGDADFSPAATASSELFVTYQSDNHQVATIVDNKIHIVGAGNAVITAVQAGNDAWNSAPAQTQDLTVLRKTLTVGGSVQADDKYYDGDTAATISGAVLSGVLLADEGQVALSMGSIGHFAQTDVGTKLAVLTTMSLTGLRADHYVVQQPSLHADILARPITVTADAQSKTYGDADPDLTWQVTAGNLIGDDTAMGELTREAGEAFGVYDILVGTLDFGANYDVTFDSGLLTIMKRPLVIRALAAEKTYGEADPVWATEVINLASWDHEAVVTGLKMTRELGEAVGIYTITPSGAVAENYSIVMLQGALTINPRQLVITATAQSKEYGTADPDLGYTITSGSLVGSDAISGKLQRELGENVGQYAILQDSLSAGDNYTLTVNPGVFTITPYAEPAAFGSVRNGYDAANSGRTSFIAEPVEGYGFAYWSDGRTVFCTQPELINPPGGIAAYTAIMWPMGPTTDKKVILMSKSDVTISDFLNGDISMILPKHVDPESVIAVTAVPDPSGNAAAPAGMTGVSQFYHLLRSENLVDSNIRIMIDLAKAGISLSDNELQSLKFYRWNTTAASWEAVSITAQGIDSAAGVLWADVDNFNTFGLFYTADELPQTGENRSLLPWLLVALAGGLMIIRLRRKRLAGKS